MRRVLCSLLFLLAAAVPTVFAEEVDERDSNRYRYSILGDVVDENGQPMPGATVRVLGTTSEQARIATVNLLSVWKMRKNIRCWFHS